MSKTSKFGFVMIGMLAVGCTTMDRSKSKDRPQQPANLREVAVDVQVLSAVLADDCQTAELGAADDDQERMVDSDSKRAPDDHGARGRPTACRQSRVQLALTAGVGDAPATVEIVSVKLFDEHGKKHHQDLVARNPQLWSVADGKYSPWDRRVSPTQKLTASFDLTAPNWDAIGGGDRWNTQGMGFQLKVTLRIGGKDRSVEYQVASPFIMTEPDVDT